MEIVITKNSIDLGDPVYMTEEKRQSLIKKLRELYGEKYVKYSKQ